MPELAGRARVRELRRGQIIAAARAVVAEQGLEALTIEALESRLDFTRGVITYHFRDKDEIVAGVLDSAIREISDSLRAALAQARAPRQRLRAVLQTMLRGYVERREAGRILLSFWSRLSTDRRVREKNARLYSAYRRQAAGLFDKGPAGRALGAVLVGLVIGLAMQETFEPGCVDLDAAVEEAVRAVLSRSSRD